MHDCALRYDCTAIYFLNIVQDCVKPKRLCMKIGSSLFRFVLTLFILGVGHSNADGFIYVANSNDGTVSVVDENFNVSFATITVGPGPFDIVITPDGHTLFVLNNDSTISVIDTTSSSFPVTATIDSTTFGGSLPGGPWSGLGISPDGSTLYLAISGLAPNVVNFSSIPPFAPVINSLSISGTLGSPGHVAITPDGTQGFTNVGVGALAFPTPSLASDTPITTTPFHSPGIYSIASETPTVPLAFVSATNTHLITKGLLMVIDPSTDMLTTTVGLNGDNPSGVAISPIVSGNQYVYVANSDTNKVSVVNSTTFTGGTAVSVGNLPKAIATTVDGQFAYVSNFNDNTLSVLNISNPGAPFETKTVHVGSGPNAIVAGPANFVPAILTPPTSLTGTQKKNDFGVIYELFNILQWQPGTIAAASFNIYRDGVLIANVSGSTTTYQDHDREKNVAVTYAVTAVSSSGVESTPITVTIQ